MDNFRIADKHTQNRGILSNVLHRL